MSSLKNILIIKESLNSKSILIPDDTNCSTFTLDESDFENKISNLKEASYDEAKILGFVPSDDIQEFLFRVVKPNGKLLIEGGINDRDEGQALSVDLKIQGFVDLMAAKDADGSRFILCQRPSYDIDTQAKIETNVNISSESKWKMATDDLSDEGLVNEDDLLDDIVLPKPKVCGPGEGGKKRACKDCSCGLKEIEEKEKEQIDKGQTPEERSFKASSCGGCSRGDAFRCAGCPFLGKPAFEPGQEKLILSLADDDI
jgi:hypothetical protein